MAKIRSFVLSLLASICLHSAAQTVPSFPEPNFKLADSKQAISRHAEGKSGVQLSPNGTLTISPGQGTPTVINTLAISADGKLLAAGKDFGRVVVWDLTNKKLLCAVDTNEGIVTSVALTADGQWLATAGQGDNFRLKLWHLPEGKLARTFDGFSGYIRSLAFGQEGKWLVAWSNSGKTSILDTANGKQILALDKAFAPLLSSDGNTLLTASKDEYTLWNTSDWTKLRSFPRPPGFAIPLALNTHDGTVVTANATEFHLAGLKDGSTGAPAGLQAFAKAPHIYSDTATTACGYGTAKPARHASPA